MAADPSRSALYRLIEAGTQRRARLDLRTFVTCKRDEEWSWARIARTTGAWASVDVTDQTLIRWFPELAQTAMTARTDLEAIYSRLGSSLDRWLREAGPGMGFEVPDIAGHWREQHGIDVPPEVVSVWLDDARTREVTP